MVVWCGVRWCKVLWCGVLADIHVVRSDGLQGSGIDSKDDTMYCNT